MFENFTHRQITTSEAVINVRYAGDGPPLLLLHGRANEGSAELAVLSCPPPPPGA